MQTQITRRFFVKGAGLLTASATLAACADTTSEEPANTAAEGGASPLLAIIHTNDTHGHDVEVEATDKDEGNFSMAAVPALRKEWEDKGYDVLVFDAGDATRGMPLVDMSDGESAIAFMNSCGYDLMCIGNHEFDAGYDQIKVLEDLASFPLVSASVVDKKTHERVFTPNKLFELSDGTLVGVFGLTTPATRTTVRPEQTAPFDFLAGQDLYRCAQDQVDDLRAQGADLVVCVGHLGNQESCQPSTSTEVLTHVDGIDLFIDGHDHLLVEKEVEGTLLVETGCWMQNIGLVLIDAGKPTNESVAYGEFKGIDAGTQAIIDKAKERVEKELGVVLAGTDFKLDAERPGVRRHETNLGDLLCDAMLHDAETSTGAHVDAAILNAGGIRASIDAGDITLERVKAVLPYTNQVCTVKVTGAQLLEILEAACQAVGTDDELGAFPQVAGIEFTVNGTVPYEKGEQYPNTSYYGPAAPGARVTIHSVGGADFDENATYTIATSDYIAQGGSTYRALKIASESQEPITCDFDYEALVSYLIGPLDHKVADRYRSPQGRITIVGEGQMTG
jgi:5'-nucleotidase